MHLVCDPNPFCFGSISALRAILPHLTPRPRITLLAGGAVRDQAASELFDHVIDMDVKNADAVRPVLERLNADAYLAVTNNTNVPTALELGIPLAFVDILFWMKRRVTPAMRHADVYLIEAFPGVEATLDRYRDAMGPHEIVGALVHSEPPAHAHGPPLDLLVNFGGASSPHIVPGRNTPYPKLMTLLAAEVGAARRLPSDRILVATGAAAVAAVLADGPSPIPLACLDQDAYLARLASASRFLTAPGLNAPFEAFRFDVPTAFLPPQNLTQVFQLAVFRDAGLAPEGLCITELYPDLHIDPTEAEEIGTATVLGGLRRLAGDIRAQRRVLDLVLDQLGGDADAQRQRQRAFLDRLGRDGPQHAGTVLGRWLADVDARRTRCPS